MKRELSDVTKGCVCDQQVFVPTISTLLPSPRYFPFLHTGQRAPKCWRALLECVCDRDRHSPNGVPSLVAPFSRYRLVFCTTSASELIPVNLLVSGIFKKPSVIVVGPKKTSFLSSVLGVSFARVRASRQ